MIDPLQGVIPFPGNQPPAAIAGGGYVGGRVYSYGSTINVNLALVANVSYFCPMFVSQNHAFDRIAFEVQATGTAANARLALYSMQNGIPSSLIFDAGNAAGGVGTTGLKLSNLQGTVIPAGLYQIAMVADGTMTVFALTSTQGPQLGAVGLTSMSAPDTQISAAMAFGAFPQNAFSGAMGAITYANANSPAIGLRA